MRTPCTGAEVVAAFALTFFSSAVVLAYAQDWSAGTITPWAILIVSLIAATAAAVALLVPALRRYED